jgi:hypothetical protein
VVAIREISEWERLRAFCNLVLRWGVERDEKERMKIMEECRAYRYKRAKRLMVDEVYKNIKMQTLAENDHNGLG